MTTILWYLLLGDLSRGFGPDNGLFSLTLFFLRCVEDTEASVRDAIDEFDPLVVFLVDIGDGRIVETRLRARPSVKRSIQVPVPS